MRTNVGEALGFSVAQLHTSYLNLLRTNLEVIHSYLDLIETVESAATRERIRTVATQAYIAADQAYYRQASTSARDSAPMEQFEQLRKRIAQICNQ